MEPEILLVNDDGIDSPALLPTLEALNQIGNVTAIIPLKQQSWTSKINTRISKDAKLERRMIGEFECFTVDLYPADCANLGIYLTKAKPDIVISGANVGHNVGLHAFFSSGTIGAAIEGVIAGIPSIAVSCAYQPKQELVSNEFRKSLSILPKLIISFVNNNSNFALLNLNLPLGLPSKELHPVGIDNFCFGSLFNIDGDKVTPKHYYDLNRPFSDIKGMDTWARKEQLASLTAFDKNIQIVEKNILSEWLVSNELFRG